MTILGSKEIALASTDVKLFALNIFTFPLIAVLRFIGFVSYGNPMSAQKAIRATNGYIVRRRRL